MSKTHVTNEEEFTEWTIAPSKFVEQSIDFLKEELSEFGIIIDESSDAIFMIPEGDMLRYFVPPEAVIETEESFGEASQIVFEARLVVTFDGPVWIVSTHTIH